jgi:molecular chaperone Hsp33
MDYKQIDESFNVPLSYKCTCSPERALAPLALFSRDDIRQMVDEGGSDVICQFCGRKYSFSREDLLALTATHDA